MYFHYFILLLITFNSSFFKNKSDLNSFLKPYIVQYHFKRDESDYQFDISIFSKVIKSMKSSLERKWGRSNFDNALSHIKNVFIFNYYY